MKRQAFYLVTAVIGVQLGLLVFATVSCMLLRIEKCDGSKIESLFTMITTQVFALFSAEKSGLVK